MLLHGASSPAVLRPQPGAAANLSTAPRPPLGQGRFMDCAAVMTARLSSGPGSGTDTGHVNSVTLVGRVSAAPDVRDLPSGDRLVTLRVVVDRPPDRGATKRVVDVIDVACWSKRTQRTATSLAPDDTIRVEGSLRRRFFATGGGRASRYEVETSRLVRVSLPQAG